LRGYLISAVHLGGFEGYSFSHNVTTTDGARPRVAPEAPSFEICSAGQDGAAPSCGPEESPTTTEATAATTPPGESASISPGALAGLGGVAIVGLGAIAMALTRRRRRP
jgi:hypothetical protein